MISYEDIFAEITIILSWPVNELIKLAKGLRKKIIQAEFEKKSSVLFLSTFRVLSEWESDILLNDDVMKTRKAMREIAIFTQSSLK